ncbi:hypothetical protein BD289DRAFT_487086 [Coniella lustricola]|uniref:Zn(2)-C6 fungal-type domain-containing protein n=1 Tax=Coniella lustricola TaxID=2025994 RepID=A0A2T2ZSZ4_9PEZI|nr:hypothetical protein BD289DRAFT_487086 [Coniella lustricola]
MDAQNMVDSVTVKAASPVDGAASHGDLSLEVCSPQNSQNGSVNATSPITEQRTSKVAACLACRKSKVRCEKGPDPVRCRRCAQTNGDCIRPTFNVGRRKGVKNKRKGLEKALYQVEEALKRAGPDVQGTDANKAISELKSMLAAGHETRLNGSVDGSNKRPRLMTNASSEQLDSSSDEEESPRTQTENPPRRQSLVSQRHVKPEERLAVDDAENPLQLLARASNLHLSPESSHDQSPATATTHPVASSVVDEADPHMRRVEAFFGTTHFNVEHGEDYDPIDLGLVTEEEAELLFDFFHKNLAHTRWGLDPTIYTVPWTRTRSPFLFTSIMAASALFMDNAAALSKRLSKHCKLLARKVIEHRYRSTEIVLAFMINVPWMGPGVHSTDDETCWYISIATTIAIDLQLPKISMPAEAFRMGTAGQLARQDCIDPEVALRSAGFKDVDPASELGRRLVRRRERCWLALFVLERGMCLARGRPYTLPVTPLIRRCDRWHISDIADPMDGALVSMAVLRRDLDGLFDTIRSLCDGSRDMLSDGSVIARSIQSTVDKFFEQWYLEWGQTIGQGPQNRLPPYVEILVTHTRLSIYSSVINHPTAPLEVRHFFRTASLSAAVNVMRAAVQGEKQLYSMPNNTAIMVSFAACFALRLSTQLSNVGSANTNSSSAALAPSVRTLIEETSDVLERIGNITLHRNGTCGLYARYLRLLVRKAAADGPQSRHGAGTPSLASGQLFSSESARSGMSFADASRKASGTHSSGLNAANFAIPQPPSAAPMNAFDAGTPSWPGSGGGGGGTNTAELFPFSSMSGDQIIEALNRAGGEFDAGFGANLGAGGAGNGGRSGAVPPPSGGGFGWEDPGAFDFLPTWSHWPDFGF